MNIQKDYNEKIMLERQWKIKIIFFRSTQNLNYLGI